MHASRMAGALAAPARPAAYKHEGGGGGGLWRERGSDRHGTHTHTPQKRWVDGPTTSGPSLPGDAWRLLLGALGRCCVRASGVRKSPNVAGRKGEAKGRQARRVHTDLAALRQTSCVGAEAKSRRRCSLFNDNQGLELQYNHESRVK